MSLLSIDISDRLSPALRHVIDKLAGAGRVEMGRAMGEEVQLAVVAHLRGLQNTRHDTANRLGASPTNYLAGAADAAAASGVVFPEAGAATLTFRHPTIARAFRDIHIAPKSGKFLAIPMNAIAYGRRPREFDQLQFVHGSQPVRTDIAAFLLVRSVTQRADRSLMPSDDEIGTAAAKGVKEYVRQSLASQN